METHQAKSTLLTAAELAKALKVGRRTIGAWTAARKIPALRLGKRCLRYDLERVRAALLKFEQEAVQ